ncbi:cysteine protease StiP domain-containing protein [Sphingomonas sp.]|jgi:hypothetical protein|uniref:cysteine protease StiP domain-containing protein n=1 Tax=Sphingomonas sp. TaxID=28214 RepID=UPI002DEB2934|nr:cysteine protease StiP domain-containing protein [Sphingomonas sp.]
MLAERRIQPANFSGSYLPEDVTFLLKPVSLAATAREQKEALIQSGRRHYSELIGKETVPDENYMALFHAAERRNRARLAADIASLAGHLARRAEGREIVLVSLARGGTPIGVLLVRMLRHLGARSVHYSVSIIRDRGIDLEALRHIASLHDPADAVFVDGWTGKGAIAGELRRALAERPFGFSPTLAVVADPAGQADIAATADDYLIASGLLNGIVSGLVSRSILSAKTVGPGDFHACVTYPQLAPQDLSRAFVDRLFDAARTSLVSDISTHCLRRAELQRACAAMLDEAMLRTGTRDPNLIKPGIAEATRVFLRRMPARLFIRDPDDPDVEHLIHLAKQAGVAVDRLSGGAYRAVAVIGRAP